MSNASLADFMGASLSSGGSCTLSETTRRQASTSVGAGTFGGAKRGLYRGAGHQAPGTMMVLRLLYGLDTGTPWTVREIGAALGVSRQWVHQAHQRALTRLQND